MIRRISGAEEIRTPDLLLAKETLYQLSHGPERQSEHTEWAYGSGVNGGFESDRGGRFWTRTRDLCLIRAVL